MCADKMKHFSHTSLQDLQMTKLVIQNVRLGGSCFHTLLDLGTCEEPGMAREAILSGKQFSTRVCFQSIRGGCVFPTVDSTLGYGNCQNQIWTSRDVHLFHFPKSPKKYLNIRTHHNWFTKLGGTVICNQLFMHI